MTTTPNKPAFCHRGHQPIDYSDFETHCTGIEEWPGWPDERMMVGHCIECKTTITYPAEVSVERHFVEVVV